MWPQVNTIVNLWKMLQKASKLKKHFEKLLRNTPQYKANSLKKDYEIVKRRDYKIIQRKNYEIGPRKDHE